MRTSKVFATFLAGIFCVSAQNAPVTLEDITLFTTESGTYKSCNGASSSQDCLKDCQTLCIAASNCNYLSFKDKTCKLSASSCDGYKRTTTQSRVCDKREYDLIFLLDESGSVGASNYAKMKQFVVDTTASLSHNIAKVIGEVSAVTYSGNVNQKYMGKTPCSIEESLRTEGFNGGSTNTQDALREAIAYRKLSSRKTIVVLLTDGTPTVYYKSNGQIGTCNGCSTVNAQTKEQGRVLTALDDTFLIYTQIKLDNPYLFDGVKNVEVVDITSWRLDQFVETLSNVIGNTVCKTNAPSKGPTQAPSSDSPSASPTRYPTLSPTLQPTTLAPSTCTVIDSGVESVKFEPDNNETEMSDFVSSMGSKVASRGIEITTEDGSYASTYVFHRTAQNLVGGFITTFSVELHNLTYAQGFGFVMHRNPEKLNNIPPSVGEGLGFSKIPNSVAVAFDMCTNRKSYVGAECGEYDIRISYNTDNEGAIPSIDRSVLKMLFNGDGSFEVKIEYLEQSSLLRIYVDDELHLEQWDFDLKEIIGGVEAYVGFTSTTTDIAVSQVITNWSLLTVPTISQNSLGVDLWENAMTKTVVADGSSLDGFSIQLRDGCKYNVTYGGYGNYMSGKYVELLDEYTETYLIGGNQPSVVDAIILDNGNGTYTAALKSTNPNATFGLWVAYGKDCSLKVDMKSAEGKSVNTADVTLVAANASECYFGSVKRAVNTLEPPPKPVPDPVDGDNGQLQGDDTNIAAIAAGGGGAAIALLAAAAVMHKYRKKWQSDKNFIDEGHIVNMEKDVQWANEASLGALSGAVLSSSQALLREKKQAMKAPKTGEISQLEKERDQLQEMVRQGKMTAQVDGSGKAVQSSNPVFNAGNQRKEFGGGEV